MSCVVVQCVDRDDFNADVGLMMIDEVSSVARNTKDSWLTMGFADVASAGALILFDI
jgi:hypothetical protein